jgi:serralysin
MTFITTNVMKAGAGVVGSTISSPGQLVLIEGVTISAADDPNNANNKSSFGILGAAGTEGSCLLLMGSVLSASSAGIASASHNYKVLISSTGVVSGGTDGILLSETSDLKNGNGDNFVENWGLVTASSGIGIRAQYSNNYISNLGTVNGIQGIVAGSPGWDNNTVVNSGKIYSVDVGVTLYGGNSSLTNSGLIRTNSFTFAVNLQGALGQTITLLNTGAIESKGNIAVLGGLEDDLLTNTGTIIGAVDLGDGNDLYDGRGGTVAGDILLGIGNDTAYGGTGDERFFGDHGDDFMDGGAGNDTFTIDITDINLTGGEDTAIGGAGDDTFNLMGGVSPKNVLSGGEGTDWLALQFGSVLPAPGTNSNAVVDLRSTSIRKVGDYWGSLQLSGIENVATLDGNDLLIGNSSNNTLLASAGDDTLEGGLGNDILDGGTATDIDFARFTGSTGAKVNLNYAGSQDTRYGKDTFVSIEGLIGGSGADSFLGDSASNTLIGNSGNDTLSGGDGFDLLRGSLGNDRLIPSP